MVAIGSKHFYVFEFSRLRDGRYIVPERWVKYKGQLHADTFEVDFSTGKALIRDEKTTLVSIKELKDNYYDLQEQNLLPDCDGMPFVMLSTSKSIDTSPNTERSYEAYAKAMPNPDRVIADGAPLYTSFADYFADDVSGNKSKSWNKHWNIYTAHRNLPRHYLQQEFHVHLISTSPTASISEQFTTLKATVECVSPPIFADTQAHHRIWIDPPIPTLLPFMTCKPARLQKSASSSTLIGLIIRCRVKLLVTLVRRGTILVGGVKLEAIRKRKSQMLATKVFFRCVSISESLAHH